MAVKPFCTFDLWTAQSGRYFPDQDLRRVLPKKAGAPMCREAHDHADSGSNAEFKLRPKTEMVPRDARRQAVCSVIYQNVYVVRPFKVSGL